MAKILIIEDDERISSLVKRGLEENGYAVETAFDGLTGKNLALRGDFDLVITDIVMPHMGGIDLCRELKAAKPHVPVIMLTALGTTDHKVEGFDAGADDYLVKPFDLRELHVRIRALLKRSAAKPADGDTVLKFADIEMDLFTKMVKRNGTEISLTPKEFKLLEYLMRNANRVLSRSEIAENVWDHHFDTGTNFIDVYINYLRKKIDRDFPAKLIHTKSGMGFILKGE